MWLRTQVLYALLWSASSFFVRHDVSVVDDRSGNHKGELALFRAESRFKIPLLQLKLFRANLSVRGGLGSRFADLI